MKNLTDSHKKRRYYAAYKSEDHKPDHSTVMFLEEGDHYILIRNYLYRCHYN